MSVHLAFGIKCNECSCFICLVAIQEILGFFRVNNEKMCLRGGVMKIQFEVFVKLIDVLIFWSD
ncbi:hypothetical protein ALP07_04649 [Pseudomonas savastanoi pv. glycinea]|nr:hypothetical protein ALQ01_05144 [Pseudomonas savastanoi pv. glycinea]RMV70183.1 hypothetical protein ALP07_04649 [Pseudomonas savastanoi pv. glycinea]